MKIITSLLFFFCVVSAFGQKNPAYLPGYVVLNSGDTITGSVMDRDDSPFGGGLLSKVKFRPDRGRNKKYKPSQILAYKRGSDWFESIWIYSETRFLKQRYVSNEEQGEQYFVKVIYKGALEVYHWEYTEDDNDYIDFIPLIKKADANDMVRATQGIFGLKRKALAKYFANCPSLVGAIETKEISSVQQIIDFYELECSY